MSAIDCIEHVHVATFCNSAQVYWPIEECDKSTVTEWKSDSGKVLNKNNIIIGGGSGEHPALVLDIDYILWYTLRWDNKDIYTLPFWDSSVEFDSWNFATSKNLYDQMQNMHFENTFEETVLISAAYLVLSELPLEECIVDPDILKFALEVRENKAFDYNYFANFRAVLDAQKYGRVVKNGESQWGYSLKDYYVDSAKDTTNE